MTPHANRLIHETSPYLLQHAHNPVDWYPWGSEALVRAQAEDKPILLSIGYAACHWCHVMAHESFEDPETAALMNELYICIKVDREERPDLDAIYMDAVQAMTGQGGWPMTVFLTPDGKPFYGGTYFPPNPRYGMPSFRQLLAAVAGAWQTRRDELTTHGMRLAEALGQGGLLLPGTVQLETGLLDHAVQRLLDTYDRDEGGFGGAPKFPQPMILDFLLQTYRRTNDERVLEAVSFTLTKMARGGIYDHLGGGFHRYSTDAEWLVPHFEKMLYDNAQLAHTYLNAWRITGNATFRRVVEETLDYVLREMTSPEGGFYSSQDADSEGEEGKFFLWTPAEINELLGEEDGQLFVAYYDVTPGGNFREGGRSRSILHVPHDQDAVAQALHVEPERLAAALLRGKHMLLKARGRRVAPGRDEKILAEWNGLMLAAFAEAGAALGRAD
ncbi:MAG TPA: thioredoxin domain-containing protein, partial [Anaerolineae bacterium]